MIDILARRRKNNPIIVGDSGVGKTALVEGLALLIVNNDVPPLLQGVEIMGLDLGLLQAGASAKGQFEDRMKQVIAEGGSAADHPLPTSAPSSAGGRSGATANLLKPPSRGELHDRGHHLERAQEVLRRTPLERRFSRSRSTSRARRSPPPCPRLRSRFEAAHSHTRTSGRRARVRLSARYISAAAPTRLSICRHLLGARYRAARSSPRRDADVLIRDARARGAQPRQERGCAHRSRRVQELEARRRATISRR
jgi:type VI secretion system protein VasG